MEDEERKNEFQRELRGQLEQTMVQGTSMDAVTLRLKTNRKQALKNRERAEAVLARRHKPTACLKNDEALMLYYKSALCFQLSGQWQDAGDSLVLCAKLLRRQGMHGQAGAVFTEAAESYLKVDLEEASRTYEVSASAYCDQGRFDIAGKIELLIADIQLRNKHWGEAILHYKRAATYFTGEQALDLCDLCWERIAECHVEVSERVRQQLRNTLT
jgi:tetratricopeptide (TPR) repeat protein